MASYMALGRYYPIPPQRQPINPKLQYKQTTHYKKKTRTPPPTPSHRQCGWNPRYTTYTTHPINLDLDAVPTGAFEITFHPTSLDTVLLHAPDGRLISPILKARLHKLINTCHSKDTTTTFPEALAGVILRHKAATYI
jgi:hypothetical protein